MKHLKKNDYQSDVRADGRTVRKMMELNVSEPVSSMVFYLNDVPNGNFGKHYHSKSTEIIWFPNGGKIEVNGEIYIMGNWDGMLLEPGDAHSYNKGDCNNVIHFAVKFPADNDKVEVK